MELRDGRERMREALAAQVEQGLHEDGDHLVVLLSLLLLAHGLLHDVLDLLLRGLGLDGRLKFSSQVRSGDFLCKG